MSAESNGPDSIQSDESQNAENENGPGGTPRGRGSGESDGLGLEGEARAEPEDARHDDLLDAAQLVGHRPRVSVKAAASA